MELTVATAPTGDPTKRFEGGEAELFEDRLLSCPDLLPVYPRCPLSPP